MTGYVNPDPTPSPDTKAFWDAANDGRFLIRHCKDCNKSHWYPRPICPFCSSTNTEWRQGSGLGAIYAFAPLRRAPNPYILAYVTLAEGPTMMTNIIGSEPEDLSTGQAVKLRFVKSVGDTSVPVFEVA